MRIDGRVITLESDDDLMDLEKMVCTRRRYLERLGRDNTPAYHRLVRLHKLLMDRDFEGFGYFSRLRMAGRLDQW